MRAIKKSALLLTSVQSDVQRSGGVVSITGLPEVRYNEIRKIKQIKSRDEVVQVVTAGDTSYTPAAGVRYAIEILDPEVKREGYQGRTRVFGYTTPPTLTTIGATAALQREYIHGKIVAQINLATQTVNGVAASLLTGTGFTFTDSAGYYPANPNSGTSRKGANVVIAKTNSDATGFTSSDVTITTAAVYEFGIGTTLASNAPVIASMTQLLISGDLDAPVTIAGLYAVAGQKYDAYTISSLAIAAAHAVSDQYALQPQELAVFVDNGTGTVTTNLAGSIAFERGMHKLIASLYENEPNSTIEWFDSDIVLSDVKAANVLFPVIASGTADTLGTQISKYTVLNRTNIGTQTVVGPDLVATGLDLDQDLTATEGSHTSAPESAGSDQSFIVGKTAATVIARVIMGDWTDAGLMIGFRKKEPYDAVMINYLDMASIGTGSSAAGTTWINGDLFVSMGTLNNAATVQTISAVAPVDAVSSLFMISVDTAGAVVASVDGVTYPIYSAGTTQMVFDAGDEIIPFYQVVNIGSGTPAVIISEFIAIADNSILV